MVSAHFFLLWWVTARAEELETRGHGNYLEVFLSIQVRWFFLVAAGRVGWGCEQRFQSIIGKSLTPLGGGAKKRPLVGGGLSSY